MFSGTLPNWPYILYGRFFVTHTLLLTQSFIILRLMTHELFYITYNQSLEKCLIA
jgi:hypothetical protein